MIASCLVHGNLPSPHLLKVGARCLTLYPLLKLDEPGKNRGLPINHLRVRETLPSRLLPSQQGASLFTSRRPRSVWELCPPPKPHQCGSPNFCWTVSLYLQLPVCGCGRKARVVALPKPWPRVLFFPTTCMPSRRGRKSPWGTS